MRPILIFLLCSCLSLSHAADSTCYGTTKQGRLEHGVQLPGGGRNFTSYGTIPELTGRTYVHSAVSKIVIEAYKDLENKTPDKVYKFAESGFRKGGKFSPHKTHQNGLSIDFIVPVINGSGKSVHLPTNAFNKYGYNIEFDNSGKYEEYQIDFEAMAAHIVALHKASLKQGVDLWRVLFDPKLQARLYATKQGAYIKKNIIIPDKKSWVRHDEHYHVDFRIKCKPLK